MAKRRWVERALLGTLMGIAAFFIERRVRRAMRRETMGGGA